MSYESSRSQTEDDIVRINVSYVAYDIINFPYFYREAPLGRTVNIGNHMIPLKMAYDFYHLNRYPLVLYLSDNKKFVEIGLITGVSALFSRPDIPPLHHPIDPTLEVTVMNPIVTVDNKIDKPKEIPLENVVLAIYIDKNVEVDDEKGPLAVKSFEGYASQILRFENDVLDNFGQQLAYGPVLSSKMYELESLSRKKSEQYVRDLIDTQERNNWRKKKYTASVGDTRDRSYMAGHSTVPFGRLQFTVDIEPAEPSKMGRFGVFSTHAKDLVEGAFIHISKRRGLRLMFPKAEQVFDYAFEDINFLFAKMAEIYPDGWVITNKQELKEYMYG